MTMSNFQGLFERKTLDLPDRLGDDFRAGGLHDAEYPDGEDRRAKNEARPSERDLIVVGKGIDEFDLEDEHREQSEG